MKIILYLWNRIAGGNCPVKVETRTPFPILFCSGLQKTGEMKTIPLTKGQVALVDDEDYNFLMLWKWCALKQDNTYYAVANNGTINKKRQQIRMHRLLMDTPKGMDCDHRFHNGLDNRKFIEINGELKQNLRNCTRSQNSMNKKPQGRSEFLGVSFSHWRDKEYIVAEITVDYKRIKLGSFPTEELAARAYDAAAKIYHGDFANLNFKE